MEILARTHWLASVLASFAGVAADPDTAPEPGAPEGDASVSVIAIDDACANCASGALSGALPGAPEAHAPRPRGEGGRYAQARAWLDQVLREFACATQAGIGLCRGE
jgi:hypothetical protein